MVKRANLLGRTSSTPPPNVSVSGVFVLVGVDDGNAEALDNMREVFSELPILMTVDEARRSAPSGIDTNVDMSTGSTSQEVGDAFVRHPANSRGGGELDFLHEVRFYLRKGRRVTKEGYGGARGGRGGGNLSLLPLCKSPA